MAMVLFTLTFTLSLSRVAEETIRDYFEARLALLEPVFPIACHRLCEGPDFSTGFHYKPPPSVTEGEPACPQCEMRHYSG